MSPGVFVEALAKILGLPARSVVVIDRALSEAGLRTRGGRGRSAAKVTPRDGARLLLAVMATPVLVRADEAILPWLRVKSFGPLPVVPAPFSAILEHEGPLPLLTMMERLIGLQPEQYADHSLVLEIGADQHAATFEVRRRGRQRFEVGFLAYPDDADDGVPARQLPTSRGDLTRSAKITEVTFQQLYSLFVPTPGPEPATTTQEKPA